MLTENIRLLMLLTAVVFPFHGTHHELIKVPRNQVSFEETGTIVMECRSSDGRRISWHVVPCLPSSEMVLWSGYDLRRNATSYCSVDKSTAGQWNLNISHRSEAAQTYICFEPGTLKNVSAELVYINNNLITHSDSSTEDLINLTCSMEFRGNWAPTIEWKEQSDQGVKFLSVNVTTVPNQRVTSTLVMEVQVGSRNYTCTAKFNFSGKPKTTTATNVPDYKRSWTSPIFIKHEAKSANNTRTVPVIAGLIGSSIVIALLFCVIYCIHARRKKENKSMQADANRQDQSSSSLINRERQEDTSLNSPIPQISASI